MALLGRLAAVFVLKLSMQCAPERVPYASTHKNLYLGTSTKEVNVAIAFSQLHRNYVSSYYSPSTTPY